jgi:sulfur-oxidizing protein SoxX
MNNRYLITAVTLLALPMGSALADAKFDKMMKDSFQANGIATLDRLNQDAAQKYCSDAATLAGKGDPKRAEAIQKANMATIKQPADGKYIGDWKSGERIAQSGRGSTWSDAPGSTNGGMCYNCHQINKTELSYGNIGPSLWNYGKLRGITDVNSATAKPIVEYTWAKLWNARGYNACSNMPRFGHNGILTEAQLQHLMALLLDPKSPINQ